MSEASRAYREVLADLRARIAEHVMSIEALNGAIQVVLANAPPETAELESLPAAHPGRFVGLSLRKAILKFLSEEPSNAYDTGLVSQALQEGGMTTNGASFTSNVSATLSDMAKKYGEVERANGTAWKLTSKGYANALGLVTDPMGNPPMNFSAEAYRAATER